MAALGATGFIRAAFGTGGVVGATGPGAGSHGFGAATGTFAAGGTTGIEQQTSGANRSEYQHFHSYLFPFVVG
ncbi:MAG TPA: hypothetical protein VF607_15635 [Verrucomicrobiae bacterium]